MEYLSNNSYLVTAIVFIVLVIAFYLLGIGFAPKVINNKIELRFNWSYPFAISLLFWAVYQFWLSSSNQKQTSINKYRTDSAEYNSMKQDRLDSQKINLSNWH